MSVSADVEIAALEGLDFVPVLPCEYSKHIHVHNPDEKAKYLILMEMECGCIFPEYLICQSGLDRFMQRTELHCTKCHKSGWRFKCTVLETLP